MFAKVVVDTKLFSLDKLFDYEIPATLPVKIGCRVQVPFGAANRYKTGYVIEFANTSDAKNVKPIHALVDKEPLIGDKEIILALRIRDKYISSMSEALKLMLPPGIDLKYEEIAVLNESDDVDAVVKRSLKQKQVVAFLRSNDGKASMSIIVSELGGNVRNSVNSLVSKGIISISQSSSVKNSEKTVKGVYYCGDDEPEELCEILSKKAPSQAKVIELLSQCEIISVSDLILFANASRAALNALYKKGYINFSDLEVRRDPTAHLSIEKTTKLNPTDEQKPVIDELANALGKAQTYLLRGVTGSGKTEVYLQVIESALKRGEGAIVLVPEISLTPQMTDRFLSRFGEGVAILHSALSLGERLDEWNRIKSGEAKVVVGARSAVFAPVNNLGVIIVDEEHETTYKSEISPRYNSLWVAKERSRLYNALLVLSSATPSIESYFHAQNGNYKLLVMDNRYNNVSLPNVTICDMRQELAQGNRSPISTALLKEIVTNLENGEQTVLFLNRRGFSTFVSCRDCGYVASCPNCSISLTYHSFNNTLSCHYCDYSVPNYSICPKCQSNHIRYFGTGTQRIEQELHNICPDASVIRMDVDTTSGKHSHESILRRFKEEKIDILLGTQMVSKGLDFPNISLVGVLAADMSLNVNDYRAAERTFNLITQVCGRAGRGDKKGRAIIQTYQPENQTILMAAQQDYSSFYNEEIIYRKLFNYPPYTDIVSVTFTGVDEKAVMNSAMQSSEYLKKQMIEHEFEFFDVSKAPMYKIQSRYRWRYWFKAVVNEKIRYVLRQVILKHNNSEVRITVDINPINMN